jgi:hypothetical protein
MIPPPCLSGAGCFCRTFAVFDLVVRPGLELAELIRRQFAPLDHICGVITEFFVIQKMLTVCKILQTKK